jgi:restriction system protein
MKLKMAKNSLFAVLLRSRWWVSAGIAAAFALLAWVLLPADFRIAGVLGCFPFVVIAVMAAWRQRNVPSAARIEATAQAVGAMAWPAFSALLEQAFRRDGYAVQPRSGAADFTLERNGRRMLVSARRWKSARAGLEPLRELQVARDAAEAPDALFIALGTLSEQAVAFAAEQRIAVWQAAEIAQALRGLPLPSAAAR